MVIRKESGKATRRLMVRGLICEQAIKRACAELIKALIWDWWVKVATFGVMNLVFFVSGFRVVGWNWG